MSILRLLCLVLTFAACTTAAELVVPTQPAETTAWPVLHQGRVKPFATAAEESLLAITGKLPFGTVVNASGQHITRTWPATDLVLAMLLAPQGWQDRPLVYTPFLATQKTLGLTGQWASLDQIEAHRNDLAEVSQRKTQSDRSGQRLGEWTREDEAMNALVGRYSETVEFLTGRTILLAPLAATKADQAWAIGLAAQVAADHNRPWRERLHNALVAPGNDGAAAALARADIWLNFEDLVRDPDPLLASAPKDGLLAPIVAASKELKSLAEGGAAVAKALPPFVAACAAAGQARDAGLTTPRSSWPSPGLIDLELFYKRSSVFTFAWLAFIFGGVTAAFGLRRGPTWRRVGTTLVVIGLVATTAGLTARCIITGLGAVTNLYETLIFVALIAGVMGLIMAKTSGNGLYLVAGAIAAGLCAMVGEAMPPEMGNNIGQLQPVLRSRFWLWIHVKTVVASYAAYALALVLGNIALWQAWREKRKVTMEESRALYRCLQVGTVLIIAGTLLGGWWADAAWGRFWGWDPKEVGALIVCLTYLIPLHLRYVGAVGPTGLAAWSVLGFLSVLWSWYGVNFILGTGLHAYGFGSGGQSIVLPLTAAQLLFTGWQLSVIKGSVAAKG